MVHDNSYWTVITDLSCPFDRDIVQGQSWALCHAFFGKTSTGRILTAFWMVLAISSAYSSVSLSPPVLVAWLGLPPVGRLALLLALGLAWRFGSFAVLVWFGWSPLVLLLY